MHIFEFEVWRYFTVSRLFTLLKSLILPCMVSVTNCPIMQNFNFNLQSGFGNRYKSFVCRQTIFLICENCLIKRKNIIFNWVKVVDTKRPARLNLDLGFGTKWPLSKTATQEVWKSSDAITNWPFRDKSDTLRITIQLKSGLTFISLNLTCSFLQV